MHRQHAPIAQAQWSDEAMDLILHLLKRNPGERYSAKQALTHKWLADVRITPSLPSYAFAGGPNPTIPEPSSAHRRIPSVTMSPGSGTIPTNHSEGSDCGLNPFSREGPSRRRQKRSRRELEANIAGLLLGL